MRMTFSRALLTLAAIGALGCGLDATEVIRVAAGFAGQSAREEFRWDGSLAGGQDFEVFGVNGAVRAEASPSGRAELVAVKTGRRDDPADVRIEVIEHERGVTVCAIYPPRPGSEPAVCAPGGPRRTGRSARNDVSVEFTVRVPAGSNFVGRTVNGEISANGLRGRVDVDTVNGAARLSTTEYGTAETVNGSIDADIGRADWTGDLEFKTVNGSIELGITGGLNADLDARTVNGTISTDFPITVMGTLGRRELRGTIGEGGRRLSLSTVNGSIRLRRE